MDILTILLGVMGGLGIFLLGMKHLSEGLQAVSGKRLRNFIATATTHRLAGVLTGVVSTVIVQSSSIITVMVVGLVSTGLMTLTQAINVIIGSNIGTTATAWIIAVVPQVGNLGLGVISIASIFYFFSTKEKIRNIGLACLGFGLIFFGLDLMKKGMDPVATNETVKAWFAMLHADTFWGLIKCITASAVFTAIIQSSAATTAIAMTLATQGLISFETALAAVLGMNIGTTATAWLASLGATTEAKRAAMAHTLFNIIGVIIFTPFFLSIVVPHVRSVFPNATMPVTTDGVTSFPYIAAPMAYIHSMFNVVNTCIFLPFVKLFAKLVTRIIPAKPGSEVPRLTILNAKMIRTPMLAVEQAAHEVFFMADSDLDLLASFRRLLASGEENAELEEHIFHRESILDTIQREITDFLGQIMTGRLPHDVAIMARTLLRVTDEYESVSDECAALLKMLRRMRTNNLPLSDQGRSELLQIHDLVAQFAAYISTAVKADVPNQPNMLTHMKADAENIKIMINDIRNIHISRLESSAANALKIVVCMDILNAYNRIKEDYVNIAETLVGGKNLV
jgi:phosphate:Na+ symporter